jgi:hypothetical protein
MVANGIQTKRQWQGLLGYVLGVAESVSIEVGLSQDMRIRNYW